VGFDGAQDVITLAHRARDRSGFALGAVLAAEWLLGAGRGLHEFDEVVGAWLARGEGERA
jgi:4-hydroxy-tetrahydrodipicolinate reductase